MKRITIEAGCLVRRAVRCFCMELNLEVTEDRGWLDSFFVVTGSTDKIALLKEAIQRVGGE